MPNFLSSACSDTICCMIYWWRFSWIAVLAVKVDFFCDIFGIHIDKAFNRGPYEKLVFCYLQVYH